MTLNLRAQVTLEILQAHFSLYGQMPAQHKVALRLGLSPSSTDIVRAAYTALERAGLIRRLGPGWSRIKLVETEDKDAADFARRANTDARYSQHRQIVEALQVSAPVALKDKFRGLKPLSQRAKVFWLDGFPAAPTGSAA